MKKYYFYDTDDSGNEDYDIAGEDYCKFLDTCLKYCSSVSFIVYSVSWSNGDMISVTPEELEKYRIPVTENLLKHYKQAERETYRSPVPGDLLKCYYPDEKTDIPKGWYEIRHYHLCPEVKEMLMNISDSVFQWVCHWGFTNPEDIAFWRKDGSAFFTSVTHEGECFLMPNNDEDVSEIVSANEWSTFSKRVFPPS